MYEVEVKAKLRDREAVLSKLKALDCKFSEELHQIDEIFTPAIEVFPPPKGRPVLRIRTQNGKYIFTLKINQTSRQDCIEHELNFENLEQMKAIILALGFKEDVIVDKKRIKTKYKDMEIVLDDVKGLGEYVEAEKVTDIANPQARIKIQEELFEFLDTLGVTKDDRIIDGKYDIMLYDKLNHK